ncbi:MAG: DUF1801 domain-containing protein [Candidatus Saccharimonadales bacterium]
MAGQKTKITDASVEDFINSVDNKTRRQDGFELLEIYKRVTAFEPKMWGPGIIGFGVWHYKSERSSQEGDWPLAAFSPRKQNLTLYVNPRDFPELLEDLGKHTTSVACLYINKLDDVDMKVLEKLIAASFKRAKERYAK